MPPANRTLKAGSPVVAAALAALVLAACGGNGENRTAAPKQGDRFNSAGNAKISAKTVGPGYMRAVVVRAVDKKTGVPVRDAKVDIYGEMTAPHTMSLYHKRLREISRGAYKGPYTFIMPGQWIVHIVVDSKQEGASTANFPVNING